MSGRKWVLVPSVMNYPVLAEVERTFVDDKDVKLVPLVMTVINDYSDEGQVESMRNEIRNGIELLSDRIEDGDEVYMIVGGSCLGVSFAVEELMKRGIRFNRLVFEKKIDRYAVIE